ncbi:MAG: hypothetical protein M4D80_21585 [Myxococcota bacterium]|nr:hypothetical protein [Deltaproteobacteria bacterium]MDQ3337761.1 hypothetical protein [Myxococcota bacterium]
MKAIEDAPLFLDVPRTSVPWTCDDTPPAFGHEATAVVETVALRDLRSPAAALPIRIADLRGHPAPLRLAELRCDDPEPESSRAAAA